MKILAIEFFDPYYRAARHSLTQSLNISNLRLLLNVGFSSDPRLLNQDIIPHVRK
jgi:hypothetical protein